LGDGRIKDRGKRDDRHALGVTWKMEETAKYEDWDGDKHG